jgi:5-hydroxyisourate hydrolase-like protein (transthyretin family)
MRKPMSTGIRLHFSFAIAVAFAAAIAHAQDFTGRIADDSSGEPVASAELKIHKAGMRELVADLDTDRNGRFTGAALPAGDYTIDVLKPNFMTATFPVHLPSAALQISLLHFAVMDGRVTNVRGEPVAGIVRAPYGQTIGATRLTVLAKQPASDEFRAIRDAALDDDGHYRFFDLPPGQYELGMWYYGINEGSGMQLYPDNANPRVFTVAGGEVYKDLNFLIAPNPEYKVSGTVALPAPGQKFALALGLPDQPILPVAIALAADDGSFHFDKVPAGTYDLFVGGPTGGYGAFDSILNDKTEPQFGRMRIQVAGSDVTGLAVAVAAARSIGIVLRPFKTTEFPAACPQNVTVNFDSLDPWGIRFNITAQAGLAKEQTVPNLAPGRFRLSASDLGTGCYLAGESVVDLSKNIEQPVVVQVAAAGSIRGVTPKPGDAIELMDAEGKQSQLAFSDAEGHFSFKTLHPGRYRITSQKSKQTKEIEITGGTETTIDLGGAQ